MIQSSTDDIDFLPPMSPENKCSNDSIHCPPLRHYGTPSSSCCCQAETLSVARKLASDRVVPFLSFQEAISDSSNSSRSSTDFMEEDADENNDEQLHLPEAFLAPRFSKQPQKRVLFLDRHNLMSSPSRTPTASTYSFFTNEPVRQRKQEEITGAMDYESVWSCPKIPEMHSDYNGDYSYHPSIQMRRQTVVNDDNDEAGAFFGTSASLFAL